MELFIAFLGLIIAWKTYQITVKPKIVEPIEEKNNLLLNYKATQSTSLEVQRLIQEYIDDKNGGNEEMYPGITFQQFLDTMKSEFDKSLSDKLFNELKENKDLTKSIIASMLKMIETQHNALLQLKTQLIFYIK